MQNNVEKYFSEKYFSIIMKEFVGRKRELQTLRAFLKRNGGSVLIYGKRKVGKTRLLLEALKESPGRVVYFECLKASLSENLEAFCLALSEAGILPKGLYFRSFPEAFSYLDSLEGTFDVAIDEYPYLKVFEKGEKVDSIFQSIVDSKLNNVRLYLCGSQLSVMKGLLEEGNALYGRFSSVIRLQELNYLEASLFYPGKTPYEKAAFHAVFGGSPFINEQIDPKASLKENAERLILEPTSSVYAYCENVLVSDLPRKLGAERVLRALGNGKKRYRELEETLHMDRNGLLSKQLKALEEMELIGKTHPINRPDDPKKVFYETSDNLLRFWFSYVHKRKSALLSVGPSSFWHNYVEPTVGEYVARRFEGLCRSYFSLLSRIGKRPEISMVGTYYFDDPEERRNGEFDVAIKEGEGYAVYEAKYLSAPMKMKDMEGELLSMKRIKELPIHEYGFVSASGFEGKTEGTEQIEGKDLYDPALLS